MRTVSHLRRAALTAAVVVLAAGCGGDPAPPAPPPAQIVTTEQSTTAPFEPNWPTIAQGRPLPDASSVQVDLTDPEDVAVKSLQIIHTRDTTQEQRSGDSLERAADLMTDTLREELIVDSSSVRPTRQWGSWVEREASIAADASLMVEQHPPDEPERRRRAIEVDEYVTAASGTKIGKFRSVHYVDIRKDEDEWKIDALQLGARQPTPR